MVKDVNQLEFADLSDADRVQYDHLINTQYDSEELLLPSRLYLLDLGHPPTFNHHLTKDALKLCPPLRINGQKILVNAHGVDGLQFMQPKASIKEYKEIMPLERDLVEVVRSLEAFNSPPNSSAIGLGQSKGLMSLRLLADIVHPPPDSLLPLNEVDVQMVSGQHWARQEVSEWISFDEGGSSAPSCSMNDILCFNLINPLF